MLRNSRNTRSLKENLMLASSTAFVAGAVNVASLIAFFAFSSNITGHVANLAKNVVALDIYDVVSVGLWLASFFAGAYTSSYVIKTYNNRYSAYRAHSIPIIIEIVVLVIVALYCDLFYEGKQLETEFIVGCLLFSMGLQNGMVTVISGGLVKSTHLTGLITDLGAEIADYFHPRSDRPLELKNKLVVRLTILFFYILGGVLGGYSFFYFKFEIFYAIPAILLTILYYDLSTIIVHKTATVFKPKRYTGSK